MPRFRIITPEGDWVVFVPLPDDLRERNRRIALAVVARSPIRRLVAFKRECGSENLKLYSDVGGDYTRDYVSADDADVQAFNVFTHRGWRDPAFLERRDGLRNRRSRPGPARRAGPDAALDYSRLDARGPRDGMYLKLECGV